jgi:hypothetical protein
MKIIAASLCLIMVGALTNARTQQHAQTTPQTVSPEASERRVALTEQAVAVDAKGAPALAANLRTTALNGTVDAPVQNIELTVENRSQFFYTYVSGWVTFYDAAGVRCGEGLFKLDAFAPGESVAVDAPGLSLRCAPATWRIAATTLLTRTSDVAKPNEPTPPQEATTPSSLSLAPAGGSHAAPPLAASAEQKIPALSININGRVLPIQLNNPLDVKVGAERVRIVLSPAP